MERVEALSRSVEVLQGLVRRSAPPSTRIVEVAPRLSDREQLHPPEVATADDPFWPRVAYPARPLAPPPGSAFLTLATAAAEAVGFLVTGLRGAGLEHAVAEVAGLQRQGVTIKPVFLCDAPDFGPMTRRGYVTEFLPPGADAEGWRRDFIARKWGLARWEDLRHIRAPAPAPAPATAPAPRQAPAPAKRARGRAAVIAWDLAHNPAGRAMVLYDLLAQDWDVDLVGPTWERYGGRVWPPLDGSGRRIRAFPCRTLEDFWPAALAIASAADYDLVVVCKPRLPSLLLGSLVKQRCGCPLVLDVDDLELSFFPDETGATLDDLEAGGPQAMVEPYAELPTRAADALVGDADAVIVSNAALRQRFGGIVVRHARDEDTFHPDRFDRAAARARMGIEAGDHAIVFVGTARAHKGVFDIARTLDALPDKRFVLHLVGTIGDRRVRAELDRHRGARIIYHPDCSFDELPEKLAAADSVVLLQDPSHPICRFQIPAKISDAAAFGLPILTTDVPPLRDLVPQGLVTLVEPAGLGKALGDLLDNRDGTAERQRRRTVREAFEQELGLRVNRARLDLAIALAAKAGPGLPPSYRRLLAMTGRAFTALRGRATSATGAAAGVSRARPFDLVMFWKQNDSGIYGRRSDMLMKYLPASGRVGRILQIDAPLEVADLAALTEPGRGSAARLILNNIIDNQFGLRDDGGRLPRTFLWDRKGRHPVLPHVGRSLADYPAWVEAQMQAAGIDPANAFAWICPVVFDFPAVAQRIPFRGIIGDIIDDQRNFAMAESYRQRIIASYDATLPLFDLTFTNCAPVAEAFANLVGSITVVPNGAELGERRQVALPDRLAALPRPLAGYVGNLRDRIDWGLLEAAARSLPEVSFAIVGGGAREGETTALETLPNVTFTGPVPYETAMACMDAFDVALVPHLRNALTATMNPLKIYNYLAARKPVVSTEIENVDPALRAFISFASDAGGFAAAIRAACRARPPDGPAFEVAIAGISWEARAQAILARIDAWQGRT